MAAQEMAGTQAAEALHVRFCAGMMDLGIREAWGDDQIFFRCGCQMAVWRKPDSRGTFPHRVDCCNTPHFDRLKILLQEKPTMLMEPCELSLIYRDPPENLADVQEKE